MYRLLRKGWSKHADFMLLDLICCEAAFLLSSYIRLGNQMAIDSGYIRTALMLLMIGFAVSFMHEGYHNILGRGYLREARHTFAHISLIYSCAIICFYLTQATLFLSRQIVIVAWMLSLLGSYVIHITWKRVLQQIARQMSFDRLLLLVLYREQTEAVIQTIRKQHLPYRIKGIALLDAETACREESYDGIPVLTNVTCFTHFIHNNVLDEVLISVPEDRVLPENIRDICIQSGLTVHINLTVPENPYGRSVVEKIGPWLVLTNSITLINPRDALIKRCMDIVGGIVGLCITGVIFIFVAPAIKRADPGPVFFRQERVGKNGRRFKMYKFRSMYVDAETRKAELMVQNEIKGMMFKMTDDPRIIHGIGQYIRKTSLDEFPQFFNVLKGDMSLVGTRPPTPDEYEQYELRHLKRMAIRPGITGMWQVSGRNEITDFEEVVKLDTQYIVNWSLGMDIKILFKTIRLLIRRDESK